MFLSNNGILIVNRGDSFILTVAINLGTGLDPHYYNLTKNDKLYLGVMEPNMSFENAVIRKTIKDTVTTDTNVQYIFNSGDTEYLLPGKYYYMVKLERPQEDGTVLVDTIIDKTEFRILD